MTIPTTEIRTEVTVASSTVVVTEVLPTVETAVPEIEPVEEAPVVPDLAVIEETTAATDTVGVDNSLPVDYVTSTPFH